MNMVAGNLQVRGRLGFRGGGGVRGGKAEGKGERGQRRRSMSERGRWEGELLQLQIQESTKTFNRKLHSTSIIDCTTVVFEPLAWISMRWHQSFAKEQTVQMRPRIAVSSNATCINLYLSTILRLSPSKGELSFQLLYLQDIMAMLRLHCQQLLLLLSGTLQIYSAVRRNPCIAC